jgi:hypothetical protein
MTKFGSIIMTGAVLVTAAIGLSAPAQARTYSYVEIGVGNYPVYGGGYYYPGPRYYPGRYYDGDYRDYHHDRWERERYWEWRERQAWPGDGYYRGYYRGYYHCRTDWRWGGYHHRYRVPVRVCH